jgi:hypothetical protein
VTKTLSPDQKVSASILVNRIDLNCSTAQSETKLQKPTKILGSVSSTWKVVSDGDFDVADRTHASVQLVEIWKRAGNYEWIRSHTYNAQGAERATQLCFRNDGTLARVRQATSIPALDEASALQAYVNEDGSLIQASEGFDTKDEAIAMTVKELPYYKVVK